MSYWEELCDIMEWSKTHVTSTFHICWGAQAGLYYHYGIQKYPRKEKLSGVYEHRVLHHSVPLVRSMDDYMNCPHSRWTEVRREDILKHPELCILAESEEAGVLLITDKEGRIISYNNIELPKEDTEKFLYQKLAAFRTGYPPIVMEGLTDPLYLYYSDSKVLQQLHIFPYIQLAVFFLFLGVAIVALVSLKKSDQNRIWEGLARETAHQLGTPHLVAHGMEAVP